MHVGTQCLDFQDLRGTYETAIFAGQGPTLLIGASDWEPGLYDAEFVANVSRVASADLLDTIDQAALLKFSKGALVGLAHQEKGVIIYRSKSLIPDTVATY